MQLFAIDQAFGAAMRPSADDDEAKSKSPAEAKHANDADSGSVVGLALNAGAAEEQPDDVNARADATNSASGRVVTSASVPPVDVAPPAGMNASASGGGGGGGGGRSGSASQTEEGAAHEVGGEDALPDDVRVGFDAGADTNAVRADDDGLTIAESPAFPPAVALAAATGAVLGPTSDLMSDVVTIAEHIARPSAALAPTAKAATGLTDDILDVAVPTIASDATTLTATIEATKDVVTRAATPIVEPDVTSIAPTLATVVDSAADLLPEVTTIAEQAIAPVAPIRASAAHAATDLAESVVAVAEMLTETVVPVLTATADAVGNAAQDVVATAAPVTGSLLPTLATAVEATPEIVSDVVAIAEPVSSAVMPTLTAVANVAGGIVGSTQKIVEPTVQLTEPILTWVADGASTHTDDVAKTVDQSVEAVLPVVTTTAGVASGAVSDVAAIVEKTAEAVALPSLSSIDAPHDVASDAPKLAEAIAQSAQTVLAAGTNSLTELGKVTHDFDIDLRGDPDPSPDAAPVPASPAATIKEALYDPVEAPLPAQESDVIGSGGTIVFDMPKPLAVPANDLFTKGSYTDYGVALTNDAGKSLATAPITMDEPIAKSSHQAQPADKHDEGDRDLADAAQAPVLAKLPGPLDDIGLHHGDSII